MSSEDITVHVLREIRDEVRGLRLDVGETNARLDETNARLDETNARLDRAREELLRRIVESEVRTATALAGVTGAVREVRDLLADRLDLRDRVARCERDIDWLKNRVGDPGGV